MPNICVVLQFRQITFKSEATKNFDIGLLLLSLLLLLLLLPLWSHNTEDEDGFFNILRSPKPSSLRGSENLRSFGKSKNLKEV